MVTAACSSTSGPEGGEAAASSNACRQDDQKLLDSSPILAERPSGAEQVDSYRECDEGEPAVGRFVQTALVPDQVVAFYQEKLPTRGWKIRSLRPGPYPTGSPSHGDLFCATSSIGGAPAYLELWYPDEDSGLLDGRGVGTVYALDLSRQPRVDTGCSGA